MLTTSRTSIPIDQADQRRTNVDGRPGCSHITLSGNQGRLEIAAKGGAGRRPAKIAGAPMDQSREAHHPARPRHSPVGGGEASGGQDPARYSR
jgi:hypothetical protein